MELSGQLYALATLPPEKNPSTHEIGGWVGPSVILDIFGEEKNLVNLLREKNSVKLKERNLLLLLVIGPWIIHPIA
jgi:hypothetical protein